jgi:protein-S-isoprenylcysteine O-methyltransferase Ste14
MHATLSSILFSLPLLVAGILLHLWAKGCLRQNREVTMSGPYRFVRHPFYTANGLVDLAIAVMSGWWPLVAILPVWWLAVYIPVIRSEEAFLTREFGAVYDEYRRRVSMLLPLKTPLPVVSGGFSWNSRNIQSGVELPRILRLAAYPLLFAVWSEVVSDGMGFLFEAHHLNLWLLSVFAALHVLALQVEVHLKQRRFIMPAILSGPPARATFAVLMILLAAAVIYAETEIEPLVFGVGIPLMALSFILSLRRRSLYLVSECLALMGTAAMCELMWLMALPLVFYGALLLDSRLAPYSARPAPEWSLRLLPRFNWATAYYVMLFSGILSSVLKEAILG